MLKDLFTELPLGIELRAADMSRAGVYRIRNLRTGMFYVGSTHESFGARKYIHFRDLRRIEHRNRHLQASFNKHGEAAFVFEILHFLQRGQLERENEYLKRYWGHPLCYNIAKDATAPMLGRSPSANTRELIAAAQRGRKVKARGRPGLKRSAETRAKMSAAKVKQHKEHPLSAETRAKISAALMGNRNNVRRAQV
jgi:group I intron endonuclease